MAYDKDQIYKRAVKAAKDKRCHSIDQIISYTGIAGPTFYSYFPVESKEMKSLKEIILDNKVKTKHQLQQKFYNSNSSAERIALYKLLGNQDERDALNNRPSMSNDAHEDVIKSFKEALEQSGSAQRDFIESRKPDGKE